MVTFVKLKICIFNLFLARVTFSLFVLFSWFNAKFHSPYLILAFDINMSKGSNKIGKKLTNISVFKVTEYELFYHPALISMSERVKSLSGVRLFATPWTVAYQDPQSMGFSRQEYWNGLPFPSPGDLPDPGIEPGSPTL